jgi:hypothetical protein
VSPAEKRRYTNYTTDKNKRKRQSEIGLGTKECNPVHAQDLNDNPLYGMKTQGTFPSCDHNRCSTTSPERIGKFLSGKSTSKSITKNSQISGEREKERYDPYNTT